jgi:hypothetical protein
MSAIIGVILQSCSAVESPAKLKQVLPPGSMENRHDHRSPGG